MKTKLTLSIEKDILEKAKDYFKTNEKSLSEAIENYLKQLLEAKKREGSVVEQTKGILKDFYKGKSYKEMRDEMYKDKYGI